MVKVIHCFDILIVLSFWLGRLELQVNKHIDYLCRFRYIKSPNSKTSKTSNSKIGTKIGTRLLELFSSSPRSPFSGSDGTFVVTADIFVLRFSVSGFTGISDTWLVEDKVDDAIDDVGDDVIDVEDDEVVVREVVRKSGSVGIAVGEVVVGDAVGKTAICKKISYDIV